MNTLVSVKLNKKVKALWKNHVPKNLSNFIRTAIREQVTRDKQNILLALPDGYQKNINTSVVFLLSYVELQALDDHIYEYYGNKQRSKYIRTVVNSLLNK